MGNEALYTLKVAKEDMKFSAAHFTIFSETERERLHGHNYQVMAEVTAYACDGITFDYNILKRYLRTLCHSLDEYLLLPSASPFLSIITDKKSAKIIFNHETLSLPLSDVKLLPIENITGEALAAWFLERLAQFLQKKFREQIKHISVGLSSGNGQVVEIARDF